MSQEQLNRIRAFVDGVRRRDGNAYANRPPTAIAGIDPAVAGLEGALCGQNQESAGLEAVIRAARPVLNITNDLIQGAPLSLEPNLEAKEMADAVLIHRTALTPVVRAVGRIELKGNDRYRWAGTGWIIGSELGDDIIVTNAHVADIFTQVSSGTLVFKGADDGSGAFQKAIIDFREETAETEPREFPLTDIIHVSTSRQMDFALFRVRRTTGADRIAGPIQLQSVLPQSSDLLSAIGYPGYSDTDHDADLIRKVFGGVHQRKRLSPGRFMGLEPRGLAHDCSTLPGSSGSALIDVKSGKAVGLHYRGKVFESNHAVPAADILRLIRERPWQGISVGRGAEVEHDLASQNSNHVIKTDMSAAGAVKITVPLEITIQLGRPSTVSEVQPTSDLAGQGRVTPTRVNAERAVTAAPASLKGMPGVLAVKAGRQFRDGQITNDYAVILQVAPEALAAVSTMNIPSTIEGVPVIIEQAPLDLVLRSIISDGQEAPVQERYGYDRDLSKPMFKLDPISGKMTVRLHVSPEAGWSTLSEFISSDPFGIGNCNRMTIGMYHMSAPHVIDALLKAAKDGNRKVTMTLDRKKGDDIGGDGTKKNDLPETKTVAAWKKTLGNNFAFAPASISGPSKLFHSAYHIKVLVLSEKRQNNKWIDKAFWLSSGNWQSSNQADLSGTPIDALTFTQVKEFNREWHAIVKNEKLAAVFRAHLMQDFEDNSAASGSEVPVADPMILVPEAYFDEGQEAPRAFKVFKPLDLIDEDMTITPVLTPDNYADVVVPFIESATNSVLFENQSFSLSEDEDNIPDHLLELAKALRKQQRRGRDVRIIFRSGFGKERDTLRKLVEFGFKQSSIRFFDKVHTKGIVVDGKRVLLGSQNWTGAGTGPNRDASLLIDHPKAGEYFKEIFEYDWREMANNRVRDDRESMPPILVRRDGAESSVPPGYRLVTLGELLDS